MTHYTQPSPTPSTRLRWATLACVVAGTLLSSCGGQSSSASNNGGGDSPNAGGNGAASLAMAGAYQGSLYSSDFVSFLTPELSWYALYYLQTNPGASIYPDIYRGTLSNTTSTSASIASPGLTAFQFTTHLVNSSPSHLSTGSGSISGASATNYQIALSGITLTNNQANPNFSANAIPTYATLPGSWIGTLTDNLSAASADLTLTFSSSGALTNSASYAFCPLNLTLTAASGSANPYYIARLEIPVSTGCARTPPSSIGATVLSGIGFIHASPVSGKTKRLELILTDSTGSGISFRGDQ